MTTSVLMFLLGLVQLAAVANPVVVEGAVRNGTAGGVLPEGLRVTAIQFAEDETEVARQDAAVGGDGRFRFEFDADAGKAVTLQTEFAGVSYTRLIDDVTKGEQPSSFGAELVVFETTEDESVIKIPSDVLTVVGGGDAPYELIQVQRVLNSSDRTFIGTLEGSSQGSNQRRVLRLPVPSGAFDLLPLEGIDPATLDSQPGAIITGSPIVPGEKSISWVYKVEAAGPLQLGREVYYPTERADLLLERRLEVTSSQFQKEEEVTISGRQYDRLRADDLSPGDRLEATVSSPRTGPGAGLLVGTGAGLALLAAVGVLGFRSRRRSRSARQEPDESPPTKDSAGPEPERARLVQQIAALDDAYEAGDVGADEYRVERERLKDRLQRLTRQ